jgi:ubiquinone/menaquinone biosynthesis C-methylase UbiE
MRDAASRILGKHPNVQILAGLAEATPLSDQGVDIVAAGQSFHWFDREKARLEFARILKPEGWIVIVWNERATEATPFMAAYEDLLSKFSGEKEKVDHRRITPEVLARFYGLRGYQSRSFENSQDFDYTALQGRLLSSSYTPEVGNPNHEPMLADLRSVFENYQKHGHVRFEYITKVFYGRLS